MPYEEDPLDRAAIAVFNMVSNGMGGIDWGAVPFACDYLGVEDVDVIVERLLVIKSHKPKDERGHSNT